MNAIVKYRFPFSSLWSLFAVELIKLPPKPTIQYNKLINVKIGATTWIAEIFIAPIKKLTIKESTTILIFVDMDINNVGRKNSLNFLFIKS